MFMLDLFLRAVGNADAIKAEFEVAAEVMSTEARQALNEFVNWVEAKASICINTKLLIVIQLLNGKSYQNTYEWAAELSVLSGRPIEHLLRERLRDFYHRRVTFDHAFDEGEQFRYGALNAGGPGVTQYDPYCVVLKQNFGSTARKVACLPGDSLKIGFSTDGHFNPECVTESAAPYFLRHLLVGKERASEIFGSKREDWWKLVVSPDRYFEIIFVGDVSLKSVKCVRVTQDEYYGKWELAFLNLGVRRTEAERALVSDFIELRRAVLEGRVKLEVLP